MAEYETLDNIFGGNSKIWDFFLERLLFLGRYHKREKKMDHEKRNPCALLFVLVFKVHSHIHTPNMAKMNS